MARIKDVREIPLTDLHLSTGQVRTSQVDKELDELADSIRKVGLLGNL
jgi:ParB-like chromosome segregation protein Spo0J